MDQHTSLESLLSQSMDWPREERIRRESALMRELVQHDMVDHWADQGVRIKRAFIASETHSRILVDLSNLSTSARVEVRLQKNGGDPHLETKLPDTLANAHPPLLTAADLALVLDRIAKTLAA